MQREGLYTPELEHDSCGIGFVASLKNERSNKIVNDALTMLRNMEHRGACGCEPETGDGAGILIQIPHFFLREECLKIGIELPEPGMYGVGAMFLHQDPAIAEATKERLSFHIEELGFELLGYRPVPRDNSMIGASAKAVEPICEQVFVKPKTEMAPEELERRLYILRKYSTHSIGSTRRNAVPGNDYEFYWISLSCMTTIYKGLLRTDQLQQYYLDLQDTRIDSTLAMVHSRFSTNTFPQWKLAQPFRVIAHNGEINTIRGNVNWMKSKQRLFESEVFSQEDFSRLLPICDKAHSDSANLDSIVEMLVLAGRPLAHAMMMVIPEAWQADDLMDPKRKAFYEYHSALMEPWDGPASISFTDGKVIGATLDRNGLRPSRYCLTEDGLLVMASEAGALPVDESKVVKKGRLQPGKIFIADLEQGRIISDEELKDEICSKQPYDKWLKENRFYLEDIKENNKEEPQPKTTLLQRQQAAGFSTEDISDILIPMVGSGAEPVGSMGVDIPLPVLSHRSQHLSHYFKQLFAQVSNPPIDPIREKNVMSLFSALGSNRNTLAETPEHCRKIQLLHPVLSNQDLKRLKFIDGFDGFKSKVIHALFNADGRDGRLEEGVNQLCIDAEEAVLNGQEFLIISDKGKSSEKAGIPSLMAAGAVHQHLISRKLRAHASIIVEASDVRETHHYATLIGYGANAINAYVTYETLEDLRKRGILGDLAESEVVEKYQQAIGYGLLKIFSKMGISTLQSYQGAQIFEILGLGQEVVDKCFKKSISRLGGISFDGIAEEVLVWHRHAFPLTSKSNDGLTDEGVYQWKKKGEKHLFNPETVRLLQQAVRTNDYEVYKEYSRKINEQIRDTFTLRGLFEFKDRRPVPLDEVEPVENILPRFATGAMSFGSISHEAHSTLAIAMNRIGAKSNSGEGGEDYVRFERKANGDWERSAIKQVASGRFGVTSYYLANAEEIQIKMAQGAKPGEGGQLPGHKVDEWIGRVRHSTPGVGLISPPPHHDIYSIEDLAQLIFDLKNANRNARINVKLVAEAGVGTIASGVAKAKADVILIAGHDGGTGASPISSIRHAGLPWELGLSEAHQTLVRNKLRSRVVLQTDGQIKSGRDVAIATLLGAEEWGVSTAALVAEGCIMMRKCHLNTCPVGVATQNKELRKMFSGKPEHVVNLFTFFVMELREIMAELGFRTINDMVGHVDALKVRTDIEHPKVNGLDLYQILYKQDEGAEAGIRHQIDQHHEINFILDNKLIKSAAPALDSATSVKAEFKIVNTDRATGAMLSHEISRIYKAQGLPDKTIHFKFNGSAGQSFGAFLAPGAYFELEGEANDYFGKGLSGGHMVVYPNRKAKFTAHENQLIGNVAFYGGTRGKAFINGLAGERFAVRNSGVEVVVEGVGDHGCEYMTGGSVIVIGETGKNFAAGMSGGQAYIFDPNGDFHNKCNLSLVDLDPLNHEDIQYIKSMIEEHVIHTNSKLGSYMLNDWDNLLSSFIKVIPRDYKAVLEQKKDDLTKAL